MEARMTTTHPAIADDGVAVPTTMVPAVVRADDIYDAALATLLAQAVRRPGRPERIGRAVLAALKALHARKRADAEQLEPWYWFLSC
jgi:hypothetical protein